MSQKELNILVKPRTDKYIYFAVIKHFLNICYSLVYIEFCVSVVVNGFL